MTRRPTPDRRALALAAVGFVSCMTPKGGAQRLDREIRARIETSALPRAPRSSTDEMPTGIRVQLHDGTVELDDVAAWVALADDRVPAASPEGAPAWTHLTALPLAPRDPGASRRDPELIAAMQRVHEGWAKALALGGYDPGRYTLLADEDASFAQVTRVLHDAGQAGLPHPVLAVRRGDGTLGVLPIGVTEICTEALDRTAPIVHGERCFLAKITVVDAMAVVRGIPSTERDGGCLRAMRAPVEPPHETDDLRWLREIGTLGDDPWAELLGDEAPNDEPRAPLRPPSAPCRGVTVAQLSAEPQTLRDAIEELAAQAGYGAPCHHATLAASDPTSWQAVISTFDVVRTLGHDWIALEVPTRPDVESCEAPQSQ